MNELQEVICIICPKGCHIEVDRRQEPWEFSGNSCKRGPIYAQKELTAPSRMLTTTIAIKGAIVPRLPVVTSSDVPKERMMDVMKALAKTQVDAPIKVGDVIVSNILDLGVDILATRTLERISH
ncbi:DUF1667 domain-containing protein [Entomospira culicis]|uniref:DUF1667 domain-containing protein n=1 Tax=Entomospira culicis TaxID=2719989 RepID=A0A968GLB0_9SPIO|nr:DUF1667 domain-containing protein [Entomospira culicis]NIZ19681.1 DUF1667 domain-containing protein [Entomospira culicis]NIZ69895.1 DUF1667 domain-containing protein [Entomospira culicis]WDI37000.1 DUF1667 domain-containing protein [Entomospira culicis]WDI38629.1 DUF1667 domain-containing protein [Entomospira culicis]